MNDLELETTLVVAPVTITLEHDFRFARIYSFELGRDAERVTLSWRPEDPDPEALLAERADEFARRRVGDWLLSYAPSAHRFVGMGRIAFAHACDALTFTMCLDAQVRAGR